MQRGIITYDFYYSDYSGGSETVIPRQDFKKYIRMAEDCVLPYIKGEGFEKEVGRALCDAAERLYRIEKRGGVSSETIDGYRVDYAESNSDFGDVAAAVSRRLAGLGIMYMGVE